MATDGGNRSSSVELAVTITNVKNQPPQWDNDTYSVVIPENTVRDTPIVVSLPADMLVGAQSINRHTQLSVPGKYCSSCLNVIKHFIMIKKIKIKCFVFLIIEKRKW